MRLDVYLAEYFPEKSRSQWQKYIQQGLVKVNQTIIKDKKYTLGEDDEVSFNEPDQAMAIFTVPIIYQDDNIIVFNKPIGMLTHAKGGIAQEQTIADLMIDKTSYAADTNRPGIVHRLDRATSGVIVTVKNENTAKLLQKQFTDRKVKKTYLAIVSGHPKINEATIDVPIERNPKLPSQFRVGVNGKSAVTHYKVLHRSNNYSLLQLTPHTGRTHQLRVHMAHIATPIVGDNIYGHVKAERMFLHAQSIELTLPGGERRVFSAHLPAEFHGYLAQDGEEQ
jgi:23S rRNA pseudouridine1911/1915/1917 synthase